MKRNEFIRLSAFTAAALANPFLYSCNTASGESSLENPSFLSQLFDDAKIKEIGNAYLQAVPQENDKQKLMVILSKGFPETNDRATSANLDKTIEDDFSSNNTVTVKGWVLAVTEARQCALYSLIHK